ncbi:MarR family EPS-associated transcriptional regulator [Gynuella sunshinyii]|uniref:Transcriptional regulator n=1 Tax=Gynuella sunshinyii YC6258 TaxID=1445510 RepID=A0A0C5V7A2_9GAMM|nr:MarR family EPS-associated transcriptional regulator [Gynuella sunshinyii]AJQ95280.1 transcriptional regulator [Gynuella sunshinyii YC6258]
MPSDELSHQILTLLSDHPHTSQRQLARELGISLGKVNYCLNALIEKGILKVNNFKNSKNKAAYVYVLTPQGIEEKAKVTARFLKRKIEEFDALQAEIKELKKQIESGQESRL